MMLGGLAVSEIINYIQGNKPDEAIAAMNKFLSAPPSMPASTSPSGPVSTSPSGPSSTSPSGPSSTSPSGPSFSSPSGLSSLMAFNSLQAFHTASKTNNPLPIYTQPIKTQQPITTQQPVDINNSVSNNPSSSNNLILIISVAGAFLILILCLFLVALIFI